MVNIDSWMTLSSIMRRHAMLLSTLLILSTIPILHFTTENAVGDTNWADVSVSADSYHAIDLGTIDAGKELEIDYSADDNIDILLMSSSQYSSWQTGGSSHINSGSDYDDSSDDYVYTTDTSQQYYLILDNSDQNPEGADSTGSTVTVSGDVTVVNASAGTIKTRAWADSGSYAEIITSTIDSGEVLSIDVSCDIGLTSSDDIDFLLMDSIQASTLGSSSWSWNPHASFEDTCSHDWEYETGKDSRWSLVIDNSDQARTDGLNDGIMVDVEIDTRSLIPAVEVTDTSRMIESGDYYRVDIGLLPANGVIDIDFAFWSHGVSAALQDDLDILVMESSEANQYENGNDADILGHASMLDAGTLTSEVPPPSQSWSYQFPNAGMYSIIFDNTDEPSGGAGDGTDIQVEIGVTSLTIPSLFGNLWTGWHQSRHYADEGDIMALDLGTLNSGDDVYYYVDGNNEGGSLWSAKEYDILFMTRANYDLWVNGSTFSVISDGTNYEQGQTIPTIENISISTNTDYMLVFDAADGPNSDSADENGDWIWEFIVLSTGGSMSNLHAQDDHYEDSISVGTISPPDSDGDGVRNGLDECPSTPSGASVDSSGCTASELDGDGDGVTNDIDQCPDTPDGDEVDSTGCTILPDSDNDGVEDSADQCPDTPAGETVDSTGCSATQRDSDNDGVNDADDQCPGHDDNVDVDNDGTPDGCDALIDSDGDGVSDSEDQCEGHDDNVDADNDGTPDGCDSFVDSDGDGVEDSNDQCPGSDDNVDTDNDGTPDGCDSLIDSDGDGVADSEDQCEGHDDNSDTDNDGTPDGCDSFTDSDGDGVEDSQDQCPGSNDLVDADNDGTPDGCDSLIDSDGDGVEDSQDQCEGHDDNVDADNDGVPDGCDTLIDSDGDLVADSEDQCEGHDDNVDVDSDGTPDGCDSLIDTDGDGVSDSDDQCAGHDDNTDTDNDGTPDGCDAVDDTVVPNPDDENTTGGGDDDTNVTGGPDSSNNAEDNEEESDAISMPLMLGIGAGVIVLLVVVIIAVQMLRGGKKPPQAPMRGLM